MLRAQAGRLVGALALIGLNRLSGLVVPFTLKLLIDGMVSAGRVRPLHWIVAGAAAALVVEATTAFSLTRLLGVTTHLAVMRLRRRVHAHLLHLPLRYFEAHRTGALISRVMSDCDAVRSLMGTGVAQLGGLAAALIVSFCVLFTLNIRLSVVCVVILVVYGFGVAIAGRRLRVRFGEISDDRAAVAGRLQHSLEGMWTIKAYRGEARERQAFAEGVDALYGSIAGYLTGSAAMVAWSRLAFGGMTVAVLLLGGEAVRAGRLSAGGLVLYLWLTGVMASLVMELALTSGAPFVEAFAAMDRVGEILGTPREGDEGRIAMTLPVTGHVAFEHVTYTHAQGGFVLRDVSFVARQGTTTAIVGRSGAGKSTLLTLLMALSKPDSGRIFVDGYDLSSVVLTDFWSQLGVVLQDNILFAGTVAENIGYAVRRAGKSDVERAGRDASCDGFVARLEHGYSTMIGPNGVGLSAGERQRIAFARAVLANPRILLLDEPTSSLDAESERAVTSALRLLRRGRTTFIATHRTAIMRDADQILVIEGGRIEERGTFQELVAAQGLFCNLILRISGTLCCEPEREHRSPLTSGRSRDNGD